MLLIWGFLALIALAPLPIGGNSPLGWTAISLAAALLLLIWALRVALRPSRHTIRAGQLLVPIALFGVVVLWVVVQTLPLTPRPWHHPVWLLAGEALGRPGLPGSISLAPYDSLTALMRLLTYAGVFWLALQIGRRPGGAGRIVTTIAFAGLAYAAYGLIAHARAPDTLLWWREWHPMVGLNSTFVNQNHYATYAGLGLLAAVGVFMVRVQGVLLHPDPPLPWRERLAALTWRSWWLVAAILCTSAALVLTTSRAGNAATALGLAALVGAFGATRLLRPEESRVIAAAMLGLGVVVLVLVGDDLNRRLEETDLANESRFTMFARMAAMITDAPWTGTGYGTFGEAFRAYSGTLSDLFWDHAHNTYLELAIELGLPATVLLLAAVLVPLALCVSTLRRRRRNALYPCLAVAASVLVGLHALLDFSLELPAIAATYAAILGAGCARALPRRQASGRPARPRRALFLQRAAGPALAAAAALVIAGLAAPRLAAYAVGLPATIARHQLERHTVPAAGQLDDAIAAGRAAAAISDRARLYHAVGLAELTQAQRPTMTPKARAAWLERAERSFRRALEAAPGDPTVWSRLAFAALQRNPRAPVIDDALRLSVLLGPNVLPIVPLRAVAAARAWDHLAPGTRSLYRAQFQHAMARSPQPFVDGLRVLEDVAMVRDSLGDQPALLTRFDRMRRILGPA